jgi:tripartite-type tricarboxylate transporter receptor subunit TctC
VGWYGIGAPKDTPAPIIATLNAALTGALAEPESKVRLAELGVEPMPMTPAQFASLTLSENDKWGKIIRTADIRLD